MTLVGGAYSIAKTNVYRSLVDQPMLANSVNPQQVAAAYCQNMVNIAPAHNQLDMARELNFASPVPAIGDKLGTFMAARLAASFGVPGLRELRPDRPGERHPGRERRATAVTYSLAQQTATISGTGARASPTPSPSGSAPANSGAGGNHRHRHWHWHWQNTSGM